MEETTKKKPKRSPTPRQRKVAKALVENALSEQPKHNKEVLASVGYGKIVQDPKRIIESEGVQAALAETGLKAALIRAGITPDKISEKINVLLEAKKDGENDYTAIDKGINHATKIYGILDETPKSPSGNTYNLFFSEDVRAKVSAIDAEIKDALTKPHAQNS